MRYEASTRTLFLAAVPEGALPVTLWVTVDGKITVLQISE
jgi:hypothetical protein